MSYRKHKVLEVRRLTEATYVVRMARDGLEFQAGQNLYVGLPGEMEKREYSIYSGVHDDFLEILVKEIPDGLVSRQLKGLQPGDGLDVDGPFGFFTVDEANLKGQKFLFVGSGTGIAPFHSIARSVSGLDFTLIHGVRSTGEMYEHHHYPDGRYISCVSQEGAGNFQGRVTDYLAAHPIHKDSLCYLCGNVNMIYDTMDILKDQGLSSAQLHAEVYF